MSYKWYHNGAAISGATDNTYTITNAQAADAGSYYVEVRNLIGAVNSSSAILTLTTVFQTAWGIQSGKVTDTGFQIDISGPPLSSYTLFTSMDSTKWTPVVTIYSASGRLNFTDPKANTRQMCFYRTTTARSITLMEESITGGTQIQVRSGRKGSQSFRHGTTGDSSYTVSKIVLRLSRTITVPSTNLNFYIGTGTNSGAITGSFVAIDPSGITNTSSGATYQTYEILYAMPVGPFTAGTRYYLNLECETGSSRPIYVEASSASVYANGTFYSAGADAGKDARFELWGQ
jgi:hypothetical protein